MAGSEVTDSFTREEEKSKRMILGSGRSGTTWVLDCLARANSLRPIFEPLHPNESEVGKRYAYRCMSIDDDDEVLKTYFLRLVSGDIRSRWIDYRGPKGLLYPNPVKFSSPRFVKGWLRGWQKYLHDRKVLGPLTNQKETLLKCIRANLLAGWLSQNLGFRTVLIVRHPCSVVESKYRLRRFWDPTEVLNKYRENERLHEVTDGRYLSQLNNNLTMIQALTLNWIIENQWPVERSALDDYAVVYYEDLLKTPEESWSRLCEHLGLKNVPDPSLMRKPSQQAALETKDHRKSLESPPWLNQLARDDLHSIQEMLDTTGCEFYSIDSIAPKTGRISIPSDVM